MNRASPTLDFALSAMLVGLLSVGALVLLCWAFMFGFWVGKLMVSIWA